MSVRKIGYWLILLCMLQFTVACSYIKSLFPDKERDYQFRAEIPELIIPDDLKSQFLGQKQPVVTNPLPVAPVIASAPVEVATAQPAATVRQPAAVAPTAVQQQPEDTKVSAPQPQSGNKSAVSSLQVDQPKTQAWRLVGRALSRQKIEIVERNQDAGYFYVKYDFEAIVPADNSIWDELTFMFGNDPSHEQEYRISLLEISPLATEVTIQNIEGQTLSNLTATHLLKLITDGINMDLPGTPAENPAP